jgi:hypothetical protein
MSDEEKKKQAGVTVLPPKKDGDQSVLPTETVLRELIEVERARIESTNKRTENARMLIEATDASDKRQYEYHMTKLTTEDAHNLRKHNLAKGVISVGGGVICLVVFVLLWAMFWGNQTQSDLAFNLIRILGIGVGGYGVFSGLINAIKRLIAENTTSKSE